MFTDTHTHPYYNSDGAEFIRNAIAAGVDRMIMPNVDVDSIAPMKDLARQFPSNLRMTVGLHPTEVKDDADEALHRILEELNSTDQYIAVGEVGMDLYWDKTFREKQMEIFDRQLSEATVRDLPVIIHCRNAVDETLEVLSGHPEARAVFHSFGGSGADVERILKTNGKSYFGINGIITFKNSDLREVVRDIPIEKILLETDSPYLAPVPFRGKPNQSAYLPYISDAVGTAFGKSREEIARITADNSIALFGF